MCGKSNQKTIPNVICHMSKKKILFVFALASCVAAAYFSLPRVAEKLIVSMALDRGVALSVEETRVEWGKIHMNNVHVSNSNGTKSGKFESVDVWLNGKFEPKEITASNGNIVVSGPIGKPQGRLKKNSVPINVKNVDVVWNVSSQEKVSAKSANADTSNGMRANAKSVTIQSKWGTIEMEGAKASKNDGPLSASVDIVKITCGNTKTRLSNVKIGEITLGENRVEVDAEAGKMILPREVSADEVKANLRVNTSENRIKIHFSVNSASVSGSHKSLSKKVVKANRMRMDGNVDIASKDRWTVNASIGSGKVSVNVDVEKQENSWKVSAEMAPTPCQEMLEAIPETMRRELDGVRFDGNMLGSFSVSSEKNKVPTVSVSLDNKCKIVSIPPAMSNTVAGRPFSRQVYTSAGKTKEVTSGRHGWVRFSSISPYMIEAAITMEDPGFNRHGGFDIEAIRNSLRENVQKRKFVRGASTIPMQLAKNMFLSRDKTATRKLQEFFLTMVIVQKMSKKEILEAYLNIIEFGPDVYGIGPASRHYFDTSPSRLSLRQAVFLASILPKPRETYFNADGSMGIGKKNQINLILDLMRRKGSITEEECGTAKEEELVFGGQPDEAPMDMSGWETR
jgi:hypothetical protein